MPRKKTGDPELNLVSFCDIVTVTTVAMFMAMIIVVDQAMKTPTIRPTPLAKAVTNAPVFYECRNNQLFPIDRDGLIAQVRDAGARIKATQAAGQQVESVRKIMEQDLGNEFYRVDNSFLMMGLTVLNPRREVPGLGLAEVENAEGAFAATLGQLNREADYLVFFVRDDAFPLFRKARDLAVKRGLTAGWEYLGRDEPITFEGMYARVRAE